MSKRSDPAHPPVTQGGDYGRPNTTTQSSATEPTPQYMEPRWTGQSNFPNPYAPNTQRQSTEQAPAGQQLAPLTYAHQPLQVAQPHPQQPGAGPTTHTQANPSPAGARADDEQRLRHRNDLVVHEFWRPTEADVDEAAYNNRLSGMPKNKYYPRPSMQRAKELWKLYRGPGSLPVNAQPAAPQAGSSRQNPPTVEIVLYPERMPFEGESFEAFYARSRLLTRLTWAQTRRIYDDEMDRRNA